jgi:hypothetical protein
MHNMPHIASNPLSNEQSDLIIHALGLSLRGGKRPRWAHRNYFVSARLGPTATAWAEIESMGYAKSRAYGRDSRIFYLTNSVCAKLPEDIRKRIPLKILLASSGEDVHKVG